jgi:lysyl-tRNA synthetase class 1
MNARLRAFLDHFGFEYEFKSATELYKSGAYDAALLNALKHFDAIMNIMIPTLGDERQQTYSPFLPISPKTGRVLYVPMKKVDAEAGTITFDDEDGEELTIPVTGGNTKLQWKPDFGMRWAALDVDFEMYGKDHQVNGKIYSSICAELGGNPPEQFCYELFLDEIGTKISKSKGNGLTIDEWLTYAPAESLALYMFQSPRKAKRLYFDVIPKAVDEYQTYLAKYPEQDQAAKLENPVWHIHGGNPPQPELAELSFSLLLNLAAACNPEDKSVLWGFISQYQPGATPERYPHLDALAGYAVRYYHDFVKPNKRYRSPTAEERAALEQLHGLLVNQGAPEHAGVDEATGQKMDYASHLMSLVYATGRDHYGKERMRDWFKALYEILLGQEQGPRMGSFIALYGRNESIALIEKALKGQSLAA